MSRKLRPENTSSLAVPPPSPEQLALLDKINLEVLGERLRRERLVHKITQRSLCEGLFTSAYLSSLELGKTRPTYPTLFNLASRLAKPFDYFLRESSGLITELGEEQASIMAARLMLLTAQTALASGGASDRAASALNQLTGHLNRLPQTEEACYHYLRARYANLEGKPNEATSELLKARGLEAVDQRQSELGVLVEKELGTAYLLLRRLGPAISQFDLALEKLEGLEQPALNSNLKAHLFEALGQCYLGLGDTGQALTYFKQAVDDVEDDLGEAEGYYNHSTSYAEQGDFLLASLNLGRAYTLYEHNNRWHSLLHHHQRLAELLLAASRYDEAEYQLGQAQKAAQFLKLTDRCLEIKGLVTLAIIQQRKGQLDKAKATLAEALSFRTECEDARELGRLYQTLAGVEAELGNRVEAEEYYQQALTILEETEGLQKELAELYHSYGQQKRQWGEALTAFEYIEKAYQLKEHALHQPPD
jgi:tetratricopeptide (TPR) repeat protein